MTPSIVEETDAIEAIGQLTDRFGVARIVTLLAEAAHERAEHLMLKGNRPEAMRRMQEYRALEKAADTLRR
jgi:hypothetical protein